MLEPRRWQLRRWLLPALWLPVALCLGAAPPPLGAGQPAGALPSATGSQTITLPGLPAVNEQALLRSLYERRHGALLWSAHERPTLQAGELAALLQSAGDCGLRPEDYAAGLIGSELARLSSGAAPPATDWQRFDRLLSLAAIRLLSHLHYGRIDARAAGFELGAARSDFDVAASVTAAAAAAHLSEIVAASEPRFYHYGLLKQALAHYRVLAADPSLPGLPAPGRRAVHPGEPYAGAPALRHLLIALGDLSPATVPEPQATILDPATAEGLERFQGRHGLPVDGALGSATYAALTTPLAQRVRQIELTLERWRWLPPFDSPPIIVNIPEFRLYAFRTPGDRVADMLQMPVIVGRAFPRTRTPVFVGELRYVVFRPYWDIPRSILLNEMLPEIRAHADYLQRNQLEIVRGPGDDAAPVAPDAQSIAALAAGQLRLRQRPGDDNALGLVKFVFPNVHDVFMHGTPAHRLFLQSRRAFSHGCIRVSDPVGLAAFVLRNASGDWDEERIVEAMHGPDSAHVELRAPIRVMILYGTALATEAGPIRFFDDIYGHDRKLEQLLNLEPVHGIDRLR